LNHDGRSERALAAPCAAFVLFFGGFTLCANIAVQLGLGLVWLQWVTPVVLVASGLGLWWLLRSWRRDAEPPPAPRPLELVRPGRFEWTALVAAALLALLRVLGGSYLLWWGLATALLTACILFGRRESEWVMPEPHSRRGDRRFVMALALLSAAVTLLAHRPDADDAYYLNVAAAALDQPALPLFSSDTLHGIPGAPTLLPNYRVHSIELLTALIASVLGCEPIWVAHLLLPPVFAALSVWAAALYLRALVGTFWRPALSVWLLVLLAAGTTHTAYGNFAFVRLFQGKAVMVCVALPLVARYALDSTAGIRPGSWLLLALSQVAAVGLSANALYAAPLTAGLTLLGSWRPSRASTRHTTLGLLASVYPLALALVVRSGFDRKVALVNAGAAVGMEQALAAVIGSGTQAWFWLAALTGAWAVLPDPRRRRSTLGFALGVLALLLNPFLDRLLADHVTGRALLWRILWVVPLPAWLAALLSAPLWSAGADPWRRTPLAALSVTLAAYLAASSGLATLSRRNGTELHAPGLKVPTREYEAAERLVRTTPRYARVLAPTTLSTWVASFRDRRYPVVVRPHYLEVLAAWIGHAEARKRLALQAWVDAEAGDRIGSARFVRTLDQLEVQAVVAERTLPWLTELQELLGGAGFSSTRHRGYVFFWRAAVPAQSTAGP